MTGLCDQGCDAGWTGTLCEKGVFSIKLGKICSKLQKKKIIKDFSKCNFIIFI